MTTSDIATPRAKAIHLAFLKENTNALEGYTEMYDLALQLEQELATADMLVTALKEYTKLLGDELNEVSPLLAVHGWVTKRREAGTAGRAKIADLEQLRRQLQQST